QECGAELCGRVRAGTEGAAGIDDDHDPARRRLFPRRPEPDPADLHRPVEGAPALLPAGLDVVRTRARESSPDALPARAVRGPDQLERAVALHFLEAAGEQLDERRPRFLGPLERDLNGDAPQRNALFSLSKKLSSWR